MNIYFVSFVDYIIGDHEITKIIAKDSAHALLTYLKLYRDWEINEDFEDLDEMQIRNMVNENGEQSILCMKD